jgi:hypothetical protein
MNSMIILAQLGKKNVLGVVLDQEKEKLLVGALKVRNLDQV